MNMMNVIYLLLITWTNLSEIFFTKMIANFFLDHAVYPVVKLKYKPGKSSDPFKSSIQLFNELFEYYFIGINIDFFSEN